jgi:hypothetical protein
MGTHGWEAAARLGPLEIEVESFLDDLAAAEYAPQALAQKVHRHGVRSVDPGRAARGAGSQQADLAAFVKRRPHGRIRETKSCRLRGFLAHLRGGDASSASQTGVTRR